jgi:hypothetical protein
VLGEEGWNGKWVQMSVSFFQSNENILKLDSGDGYTTPWYTKTHGVAHFKSVVLMMHELYLNKSVIN